MPPTHHLFALALVTLAACVKGSVSLPEPDAAGRDASPHDLASPEDFGSPIDTGRDAATPETGPMDIGALDGGAVDAGPGECAMSAECDDGFTPGAVPFCESSSSWSCLDRKCVYECGPARECHRDSAGCIVCADSITCPGESCQYDLDTAQIEMAYCARAYLAYVDQCFGTWVRLEDGEYCSLTPVGSGLLRAVLSCGICQTLLVW